MKLRLRLLALLLPLLAACATYAPTVPPGYQGPLAYLQDTGTQVSNTKAQLFYVAEIDGQNVLSSAERTRRENANKGMSLRLSLVQHTVAARPVRLKLVGTHVTGAPIHELVLRAKGEFLEVQRELTFTPEADGRYRVVGLLKPGGPEVWLEDVKTSRRLP